MCLIIHKPQNSTVKKALLENAYQYNSDGWGVMFSSEGNINSLKGFGLQPLIKTVKGLQDKEIFIHLRMRTHGSVDLENCHPFQVTEGMLMMHNGVINNVPDHRTKSDSAIFAEMIKEMISKNPDIIFDQGWQSLVENFINGSVLVFLNQQGYFTILNHDNGIEWEGLWLSNKYAWDLWNPREEVKNTHKVTSYYSWEDSWNWDSDINLNFLQSLPKDELYELICNEPDMVYEAIINQ